MEVDFAEKTFQMVDHLTGEFMEIVVFVAILPYSQFIYAEGMVSTKEPQWIAVNNNALRYFGGIPALAGEVNQIMAGRFSEVMWLLEQILWKSMDRRLAVFLLDEAAMQGSDRLRITHEAIAGHMGTAREVVTRMLRYFQSEGTVALSRGSVELTDRKRLEKLAG